MLLQKQVLKVLVLGLSLGMLAGCSAFQTKPKAAVDTKRDAVVTDMRFDAAGLVESTSESGCDIKSVKIEASKRKDMIDITCRALVEGTPVPAAIILK